MQFIFLDTVDTVCIWRCTVLHRFIVTQLWQIFIFICRELIFSHTVHCIFNLVPNSNVVNSCSKTYINKSFNKIQISWAYIKIFWLTKSKSVKKVLKWGSHSSWFHFSLGNHWSSVIKLPICCQYLYEIKSIIRLSLQSINLQSINLFTNTQQKNMAVVSEIMKLQFSISTKSDWCSNEKNMYALMQDVRKQPVFHVKLFCTIKWVRTGIKNKYQLYGLHQTIYKNWDQVA